MSALIGVLGRSFCPVTMVLGMLVGNTPVTGMLPYVIMDHPIKDPLTFTPDSSQGLNIITPPPLIDHLMDYLPWPPCNPGVGGGVAGRWEGASRCRVRAT